jgi:hypothetical protein
MQVQSPRAACSVQIYPSSHPQIICLKIKFSIVLPDGRTVLELMNVSEASNVSISTFRHMRNVYILMVHKSQAVSPGFDPSSGQVRFQVDEVVLGQVPTLNSHSTD